MSESSTESTTDKLVPDDMVAAGTLPPLKFRDMPEPVPLRKMVGPSIILAGLALGSGEFILWPYITYRSQFVFFWACLLGVATQYFINMEISRWTLATGESAITSFIRRSRHWAWIFLVLNIVTWMIPAWAKGAGQLISWLAWGPEFVDGKLVTPYETPLAIGGMFICGIILTAGPVVYETVEKIQLFLVSTIIVLIAVLAVWLVSGRPDAIVAQFTSSVTFGAPEFVPQLDPVHLTPVLLLGALAFAGAGGTMNLGQSNYIKDKGYGMGQLIGRITSPITGQDEAVAEIGYHFPHTDENLRRWRRWWKTANLEHFLSFFLTCVVCLILLSLISYVLFYDSDGKPTAGAEQYEHGIAFVWGEAQTLKSLIGPPAMTLFLVMGVAILLTTEFGVLDAASRISSDLVKVAWLRDKLWWSESKLYYLFLWGTILSGSAILLVGDEKVTNSFALFRIAAALNGAVMFLYSALLLYVNRFKLPRAIRTSWWRALIMVWAVLFFGFFAVWALVSTLQEG